MPYVVTPSFGDAIDDVANFTLQTPGFSLGTVTSSATGADTSAAPPATAASSSTDWGSLLGGIIGAGTKIASAFIGGSTTKVAIPPGYTSTPGTAAPVASSGPFGMSTTTLLLLGAAGIAGFAILKRRKG